MKRSKFDRNLSRQIDALHKAIQAARGKTRAAALAARLRLLERRIP